MNGIPWTDAQVAELLELVRQGKHNPWLAQYFGRSPSAIGMKLVMLRRAGIAVPKRELSHQPKYINVPLTKALHRKLDNHAYTLGVSMRQAVLTILEKHL